MVDSKDMTNFLVGDDTFNVWSVYIAAAKQALEDQGLIGQYKEMIEKIRTEILEVRKVNDDKIINFYNQHKDIGPSRLFEDGKIPVVDGENIEVVPNENDFNEVLMLVIKLQRIHLIFQK